MPVFTSSIEVTADYPTIKPSLNLNFARSRALDPRITFTRASVGTYVGRDGLIKTASVNEPRFDHDLDTLESLGLLIEESRTNVYPNNHDPASGTSGTATKTTVQIVLPSGETGPALETAADAFAENYRNLTASSNTAPGHLTLYAKKKTSGSTGTLTVTLEGGGTGRTFGDFSINSDTWTKITHTHDWSSSNSTLRRFDAFLQTANSSDSDTSFYLAFIQFEDGNFPTSYIPTSGSNATRSADNAEIMYDGWYNNYSSIKPSTFVGKFQTYNLSSTRIVAEGATASTFKDFSMNTMSNSTELQFVHRYTTDNSYDNSEGANITVNTPVTFAFSYDGTGGDITGSANGSTPIVGTDDLGVIQSGGDRMRIGSRGNNSLYLNGTISELRYYKFKASSAQLLLLQ